MKEWRDYAVPLSRIRQIGGASTAGETLPPEEDLQTFEVFTQKRRGLPHVHAGALHAPDMATALRLAREHYGQDEDCVHIWVAERDGLGGTGYDDGPINKAIGHDYRYVRDYQNIRQMWQKFRDDEGLKEYERDDIKEGF